MGPWDIRRKKSVSRLDTGSMQISRYTPPNRTGCSRLLPQQPCCKQFSLARVGIERYRQDSSAFGDEGEQSGKANRRYENKMHSEPGRVNALGSHLRIFLQKIMKETKICYQLNLKKPLRCLCFLALAFFPLIGAGKSGAFGGGPSWHRQSL